LMCKPSKRTEGDEYGLLRLNLTKKKKGKEKNGRKETGYP